jgi:WD40 repeat protein
VNTSEFQLNLAVVIGINDYHNGIPALGTAKQDAEAIAEILEQDYHYQVHLITEHQATSQNLQQWLAADLPVSLNKVTPSRLLFYFAGHGIALNGDDGPQGYLIPQDAKLGNVATYLPMQQVEAALTQLSCRHCLVILDCCFAGAFRWSSTRKFVSLTETIHKERYDRFIQDPAWQVITSAASDQYALDNLDLNSDRGIAQNNPQHSPFAAALMAALSGSADVYPSASNGKPAGDGIITATELYIYLRDAVEIPTITNHQRQTPQIWCLKKHDKGEYIFLSPGHPLNLPPAPPLDASKNPYRGLESFDEEHSQLFFGRTELVKKLQDFVKTHPLTVLLGASGSGKSSLVKAGLIPQLRQETTEQWCILPPMRPGEAPLQALNNALKDAQLPEVAAQNSKQNLAQSIDVWAQNHPNSQLLLFIDQSEEIITLCQNEDERKEFFQQILLVINAHRDKLRVVLSLRSDFEPQVRAVGLKCGPTDYNGGNTELKIEWQSGRFMVPAMTRGELREAIEKPAETQVMYFQPYELVEQLIDEVADMPGALPLLSFALSELYLKYLQRQWDGQNTGITIDRALTQADYQDLGGVIRSLTQRADEEYAALVKQDPAYALIIRQVMLRMIAIGGGELARRQVLLSELEYPPPKNVLVKEVIERFTNARLLVDGEDAEDRPYVEPAHDALVRGWQKLLVWKHENEESLILQRRLTPSAVEWQSAKSKEQPSGFQAKAEPAIDWLDRKIYVVENLFSKTTAQLVRVLRRSPNQQQRSGENPVDFLWNANPYLGVLDKQLHSDDNWFNQVEAEFVQESVLEKRQNRSWRWRIATAVILGLSGLTIAAVIGWNKANRQRIATEQQMLRTESKSAQLLSSSGQEFDALLTSLKAGILLRQAGWRQENKPLSTLVVNALQESVYGVREKNRLNEPSDNGHSDVVYGVSFSPDGQTIASASGDHTVKLWNLDGSLRKTLAGHDNEVRQIKFSPDGQTLASASADRTVNLWNPDGTFRQTLAGHTNTVYSVAFSPDNQLIASASADGTIKLWDRDGVLLHTLSGQSSTSPKIDRHGHTDSHQNPDSPKSLGEVRDVNFSPDGQILAAASGNTIQLWSRTGTLLKTIAGYHRPVLSVNFSPDGQMLAAASEDGTIQFWKLNGTSLAKLYEGNIVHQVKFSPDGKTIVSVGADTLVKLWNPDGSPLQVFQGYRSAVYDISFSPDGQAIASAGADGTVRIWQRNGISLQTFHEHQGDVYGAVSSPDGQLVASVGADKVVRLWQRDGKQIATLKGHTDLIHGVAFSPDGQTLASASWDGTVKLWSRNGMLIKTLKGHTGRVYGVNFSPDGEMLVSSSGDGTIRTWDRQGNPLKTLRGHTDVIHNVSFSPDGKLMVSASHDKTLRLWSRDGRLIKILVGHTNWIHAVAFSPDGKTIASASHDRTVKLWNLDGKLLQTLLGHTDKVLGVAFSPNGQTIASSSEDKTVRLWRNDGTQIAILRGHGEAIHGINFSPDGKMLATASLDNRVILWNLENLNDLDGLLTKSCNWLRGYLQNNPTVPEGDRHLCDNVPVSVTWIGVGSHF